MNDSLITAEIFGRLRQATANEPDVLAELCRDYISEARLTLVQLRDAIDMRDATMLQDRAHYLKGSSMMIGAGAVSKCCATLEQMGRERNFTGSEELLQQASAALEAVAGELVKELGPAVLPSEHSAA